MKKVLLGTTALMAGGLVAGAATAADIVPAPIPEPIEEGFTVAINGDAVSAFSLRADDSCDDFAGGTPANAAIGSVTGAEIAAAATSSGNATIATNVANHAAQLAGVGAANFGPCSFSGGTHFTSGYHDDELTHIYWDSDIDITAEITLANGLLVGLYLETDFDANGVAVGDYWMGFEGHWGTIEIGQVDQAYKQLLVWVPGAGGIATTDGMDAQVSIARTNNFVDGPIDGAGSGLNLNYFTPRIAGFRLGLSYSPDSAQDEDGSDAFNSGVQTLDSGDGYVHIWSIGLNWEHEFNNGWGVAIGGGYNAAYAESDIDSFTDCLSNASVAAAAGSAERTFGLLTGDYDCGDVDSYGVGAEFSGDIITVGGGYTRQDNQFGRDRWTAAVEGYAQLGDWQAGLGYAREEDEHAFGGFEDTADIVAVGVAKDIGPGVQVGGFLNWVQTDEAYHNTLGVGDIDAYGGGVSAVVSF